MNNKNSKKNTFIDEISNQIRDVEPKAHVRFVLQNVLLWTLGLFALIVGILSTATIMFALSHAGYDLREITHQSRTAHLLEMLPSLWLLSFVLFGFLAQKLIRSTECGYRYDLRVIMFGLLCISIGGGLLLNLLETGRYLDRQAEHFIPFHKSLEKKQRLTWVLPQEGRLAGVFEEGINGEIVPFVDFDNVVWKVDLTEHYSVWKDEFLQDDRVRIYGKKLEDGTFYVCVMRPWVVQAGIKPPEESRPPRSKGDREQNERNQKEGRTSICKELMQKPYTQLQTNIR